jgi:hypothetical protein
MDLEKVTLNFLLCVDQDNIALITSTWNTMRIDFQASNGTLSNIAFRAVYWSIAG